MPLTDLIVEMDLGDVLLDSQGRQILDSQGRTCLDSGWVAVTGDTTSEPIHIRRGMFSADVKERVADTGSMSFSLNNGPSNSAGLIGYYSLDHANHRHGFGTGSQVRVNMKRTTNYYKFQGKVASVNIESGLLSAKRSSITVLDWMDIAARTPLPRMAVQQNVRDDQAIQIILDSIGEIPAELSLAVGGQVYPYAFSDVRDGETKIMEVLNSLALSGLGRIFLRGGVTSGEVLVYMSIYDQLDMSSPVAQFDNSMLKADAERKAFQRIKRVITRVYPMQVDANLATLYTLSNSIRIPPNTSVSFTASYTDPASPGSSIAAVDVQTPVVDNDYKFSSSDGSGNDMNGDLVIDQFDPGSSGALVTFRNQGTRDGYLWMYTIRGLGLYAYDPLDYTAVDETIPEAEGGTLEYLLPYQISYNIARDFGEAFLRWYKADVTNLPTIEFNGGQSDTAMDWAVELETGALIEVIESVTGISRYYMVIGYDMDIHSRNNIPVTLYVVPTLPDAMFCKLDVVGRSELDTNAILGI